MKKRRPKRPPERRIPSQRTLEGQIVRVAPDPSKPRMVVLVRVTRTRRGMRDAIRRVVLEHESITNFMRTQGMVVTRRLKGCREVWNRGWPSWVVAHMFLNRQDLRGNSSEILGHEATHAGMAWARMRGANLKSTPGEEVLCYAVGELLKQLVNRGHPLGWWR